MAQAKDSEEGGEAIPVSDQYLGLQCKNPDPKGFRAWRRLSNIELKNTITEVFSVSSGVDYSALPDDVTRLEMYDTMMIPTNFVDSQRLRAYRTLAKSVAAQADLKKIFPCLAEGANCIKTIVQELGAAAWRRPLSDDESKQLHDLFVALNTDIGAENAARLLIQTLILSESFLYRSEMGVKGSDGVYTLTDWEMASALAYTIWRSPPDAALKTLAANKALGSDEAIKKEVDRLFADPKAKLAWKDFANMWQDARAVMKVNKEVTGFDEATRRKSMAEVGDLFSEIMGKTAEANLESLFNADSIPSTDDGKLTYDVANQSGRIAFKEADRRGILGLGSFLISTSLDVDTSPVKRGAFVIERLLCTGFAPAPITELPPRVPGQSNKDRFLALEKIPGCASCHTPMNQFGFVFENFDAMGKFRTMADGQEVKVDSTVSIDGKMQKIHSASELSAAIAKSEQGRECFARHVFRYGLGRREYAPLPIIGAKPEDTVTVTKQSDIDSCQLKSMTEAMSSNSGDLRTPVAKLLTSPAFRKRIDRKKQP